MSEQADPPLELRFDRLASLLPVFEAPDFSFGTSKAAEQFVEIAYEDGWVLTEFDWMEWLGTITTSASSRIMRRLRTRALANLRNCSLRPFGWIGSPMALWRKRVSHASSPPFCGASTDSTAKRPGRETRRPRATDGRIRSIVPSVSRSPEPSGGPSGFVYRRSRRPLFVIRHPSVSTGFRLRPTTRCRDGGASPTHSH